MVGACSRDACWCFATRGGGLYLKICWPWPRITSSPRWQWLARETRLPMVPDGTNSAASCARHKQTIHKPLSGTNHPRPLSGTNYPRPFSGTNHPRPLSGNVAWGNVGNMLVWQWGNVGRYLNSYGVMSKEFPPAPTFPPTLQRDFPHTKNKIKYDPNTPTHIRAHRGQGSGRVCPVECSADAQDMANRVRTAQQLSSEARACGC